MTLQRWLSTGRSRLIRRRVVQTSFWAVATRHMRAYTRRVTRREKAARIVAILEELYPETPVPLDHRDPFTLLVAVMLSAQTTDKKVNQVTPRLFELGPTPAASA